MKFVELRVVLEVPDDEYRTNEEIATDVTIALERTEHPNIVEVVRNTPDASG